MAISHVWVGAAMEPGYLVASLCYCDGCQGDQHALLNFDPRQHAA
ncbi:hypothetical protein [Bordetella genomosp. 9]|nr:hypothetical protein [Bordetella genomosp. 9]